MKKIHHANTNQRKTGMVILISDGIDFRKRNISNNKENNLIIKVNSSKSLATYKYTHKIIFKFM